MFRLLWDIFRHKFQDLLYILFYSFILSYKDKNCKTKKTVKQSVQQFLKLMPEDDS